MALVKPHSVLAGLRGKFGEFVVKHYGDKIVVTKVPVFKQPRTKGQKKNSSRFSQASDYAKFVQRNPEKLKTYETGAKKLRRTIRSVAMSDFLTQPRIQPIDLDKYVGEAGKRIFVHAVAKFKVTGVSLVIRTAKGKMLEQGAAETTDRSRVTWFYTAKKSVADQGPLVIEATATDRFGRTMAMSLAKNFTKWK